MRSKLTAEDVVWLEDRLSIALAPVEPRPAFVHDAKEALFNGSRYEQFDRRIAAIPLLSLAMLTMGVTLFIAMIIHRRR